MKLTCSSNLPLCQKIPKPSSKQFPRINAGILLNHSDTFARRVGQNKALGFILFGSYYGSLGVIAIGLLEKAFVYLEAPYQRPTIIAAQDIGPNSPYAKEGLSPRDRYEKMVLEIKAQSTKLIKGGIIGLLSTWFILLLKNVFRKDMPNIAL
jgi:hypothetical protein